MVKTAQVQTSKL